MVDLKSKLALSFLIAASLGVLSACSSDSTDTTGGEGTTAGTPQAEIGEFSFPDIGTAMGANSIAAQTGDMPSFSTRRLVSSGNGEVVNYGDAVQLRYDMFSWSTGELVDSTDDHTEAVLVNAGMSLNVPVALADALIGRNVGDKVQVVFAPGMSDLPERFDDTDAYVLLVELM